jgi:DNA polymerase III delta prime subunit
MQNILSHIKTHATILIGDVSIYNKLKQEIIDTKLDYLNFDYDGEEKGEKTLKLDDLEKIKSFLQNKSSDIRYVITNRNMRLTGLQNAMLKMLEEANENTKIIFVVESFSYFLPTILSRMQILDFNNFGSDNNNSNKNTKSKNIFSEYKKKLIMSKDFQGLEKLIKLEELNNRGLISEKQLTDYFALI